MGEREVEIEGLEDRIASTEAALNTANAQLEEETDSLASRSPMAGPRAPSDAALQPELPDIVESQRMPNGAESQGGRVEQLEETVAELRTELQGLTEAHSDQQKQLELAKVGAPLPILYNYILKLASVQVIFGHTQQSNLMWVDYLP